MVRVNTNAVVSTLKKYIHKIRFLFDPSIYGKVVGEMARLLWDKSTGGDPGRRSLRRLIVRPRKASYSADHLLRTPTLEQTNISKSCLPESCTYVKYGY
jgi:hypothetical protein